MQVAKYWRNKKLRYRLEGLARRQEQEIVLPAPDRAPDQNGRKPLKREPARLLQ